MRDPIRARPTEVRADASVARPASRGDARAAEGNAAVSLRRADQRKLFFFPFCNSRRLTHAVGCDTSAHKQGEDHERLAQEALAGLRDSCPRVVGATSTAQTRPTFTRMPAEGKDTPKICLGFWATVDEPNMRRVKQIGVDYVLTGGPRIPWDEAEVRARIDRFKSGGLTLCNMMISGFDDVIWGRPGADAQIANVIASIRAAARLGSPSSNTTFMQTG